MTKTTNNDRITYLTHLTYLTCFTFLTFLTYPTFSLHFLPLLQPLGKCADIGSGYLDGFVFACFRVEYASFLNIRAKRTLCGTS